MKIVDFGEIQEIVVAKVGPINDCEIDIRGTKCSCRWNTSTAISQNRFQYPLGPGMLWDVRLQYLLSLWMKGPGNGRIYTEGERIPLPSTTEAMNWAIKDHQHSRVMHLYDAVKDRDIDCFDSVGNHVPIPEGVRAMICVLALNVLQNRCRDIAKENGKLPYPRIENEFAQTKLVLDVYAGCVDDNALSGDAWEGLSGSCDKVRALARAHNALVQNELIPDDEETRAKEREIADACTDICKHIWDYGIPRCDFGETILACAQNVRDLALNNSGQKAWLVKKYTPFRYPGTKVICSPY